MALRPLPFAAFLLAAALSAGSVAAAGEVQVLAAWARATPGPTAAVYLDLLNDAGEPDRLVGASSPLAQRIEFHEHRESAGIMTMAAVPDIPLPPGERVRLAPGGRHLMLFGLTKPLRPGERFSLTLAFERAGGLTVEALTGSAGALESPAEHH
jgi:copper(I)-binding protein